MQKRSWFRFILIILIVALVAFLVLFQAKPKAQALQFDASRALLDVQAQIDFGPRTPESDAHSAVIDYIKNNLESAGWKVELQASERMGHPIVNIEASRGSGTPWVIIGAHYDSRLYADRDSNTSLAELPGPGANDGASGVAVLLELARVIPRDLDKKISLVFFDAEDQGKIPGWDWILGSREFAESLSVFPDAVVVIDMIGDADLNVYREKSSDVALTDEIWQIAAELGYGQSIINEDKHSILDDHLPFIELGIPAIDIIDFDYPYWHTSSDTLDKVSAKSLEIIGVTLLAWLKR